MTSRSVQRREAAVAGKPAPTFDQPNRAQRVAAAFNLGCGFLIYEPDVHCGVPLSRHPNTHAFVAPACTAALALTRIVPLMATWWGIDEAHALYRLTVEIPIPLWHDRGTLAEAILEAALAVRATA